MIEKYTIRYIGQEIYTCENGIASDIFFKVSKLLQYIPSPQIK